jgi:hypothetical protein
MRVAVIGLLILLALFLVTRAVYKRETLPWISMGLILIILIPTAMFEVRWQIQESKGTTAVQLASKVNNSYLHCQRFSEAFFDPNQRKGQVMWDKPTEAYMTMGACQDLFSWIESDKTNPTEKQIIAVHVLTHESIHVAGEHNEATTECYAIQKDVATAMNLGATEEQAVLLANKYYGEVYPRLSEAYQSAECMPDGKLDLSPTDGRFFN